jgi:hypothetical protein
VGGTRGGDEREASCLFYPSSCCIDQSMREPSAHFTCDSRRCMMMGCLLLFNTKYFSKHKSINCRWLVQRTTIDNQREREREIARERRIYLNRTTTTVTLSIEPRLMASCAKAAATSCADMSEANFCITNSQAAAYEN